MRDIFQYIEIDVDFCGLTYGTAPCHAILGTTGDLKCFNMVRGCQDIDNFDKGIKTIRYGMSVSGIPVGTVIFPWLKSVSMRSATVNISGFDKNMIGIGKRGTVSAKLMDSPHHDRGIDKYQAGRVDGSAQVNEGPYDPNDRGTHFGKLKHRFPFYAGRPMRVVDAYLDNGVINIVKTRHYIITDINGPDARGNVEIKGKDILDLADDKRVVVPKVVSGVLATDIGTGTLSYDLSPAGIGDVDYPVSGIGVIKSELIEYTRVGDVITVVERGVSGTAVASASAGDSFLLSFSVRRRRADLVIQDILAIADVDPAFIPTAKWDAEMSRWGSSLLLTADITKSEGANKLLGEIAVLGISLWWDDVLQEIGLKANRPPDRDVVLDITDDADIKAITQIDENDKRLTEVAIFTVPTDPTKAGNDGNNFSRQQYLVDQDAKSALQYDDSKVRRIYSRWLNHGNDSLVRIIGKRIINRFRDVPVTFDITIDAETDISLTDVIRLSSRVNQDATGKPVERLMQCVAIKEKITGHENVITAQVFPFDKRYGLIAENTRGDYSSSSVDEIAKGSYIVDNITLKFGDGTGPYVFA